MDSSDENTQKTRFVMLIVLVAGILLDLWVIFNPNKTPPLLLKAVEDRFLDRFFYFRSG